MDNINEKLDRVLATPAGEPVDAGTVEEFSTAYPSFLLPVVLRLRHPHPGLDDDVVARLVQRVALSVPDSSRVRVLIDPEGTGRYDDFYPVQQLKSTPTTDDAIDTFLSTYGNIDAEEEALLNRMIFNPVPDYAATLERETPSPGEPRDSQDVLLDAFIASDHMSNLHAGDDNRGVEGADDSGVKPQVAFSRKDNAEVQKTVKAPAGSLLSESLAKIFIKQHNYKRAYEIISSLNLNYPEKSVYFADQLRFLRKLIANQEAQARRNNIENENKK